MSIANEITRIKNNIADAYTECENKGATLPQDQNSDNLANTIASISGGGGADLSEYFNTTIEFNLSTKQSSITTNIIKKMPPITMNTASSNWSYLFDNWHGKYLIVPQITFTISPTNFSRGFSNIYIEQNNSSTQVILDLTNIFDTSNVTDFSYCFSNSYFEEIIGLNKLKTNSATNMISMFSGTRFRNATTLDLSSFNTSNVTNMSNMFSNAYGLNLDLDLSSFNTSNVTNISSMFGNINIKSLNVSNFDTSNVTKFGSAFYNVSSNMQLDLSSFTFKENANINMDRMFYNCKKTPLIDISGLDFTNSSNFSISECFANTGINCLQSDGAYADGIPYIYVKDATAQNWVLTANNGHPNTWTTDNVVIKSN